MKQKAYIYPITYKSIKSISGVYNPYKDNFMKSVGEYIDFVNKDKPSHTGIFQVLKFLPRIELIFLNWIENLPDKKMGLLQSLLFLVILRLRKFLRIKVVWTLHNKVSHSDRNMSMKKMLFKNLLVHSDLIITHAREGIVFAESIKPGISSKIFYFPHPIVPFDVLPENGGKKYDLLLWGSLLPYKGIDLFLEYLEKKNALDKFRIMIVGKASSNEFYNKLLTFQSENITIRNEFVTEDELARLIQQSRYVLFTYAGDSVLSSGALIDSIAHHALVIGPDVGAFREFGQMKIIKTYRNFDELYELLPRFLYDEIKLNTVLVSQFIDTHSWRDFARALKDRLYSNSSHEAVFSGQKQEVYDTTVKTYFNNRLS